VPLRAHHGRSRLSPAPCYLGSSWLSRGSYAIKRLSRFLWSVDKWCDNHKTTQGRQRRQLL